MRLRQLDILRGLAVLLVLGYHHDASRLWNLCGWMGVDLFFVLSGFLVSGLLFSEYQESGQIGVKRFLIRRGLKIYPAFYFLLALTILARLLRGAMSWTVAAQEALFVQNYGHQFWGHTWSLAVEEHFYLTLALVVALTVRRSQMGTCGGQAFRFLPHIILAICIATLVGRILTVLYVRPYTANMVADPTHLRADGLAFGVLLSYLYHFHHERLKGFVTRHASGIFLLTLILIAPGFIIRRELTVTLTVGFTFLYIGWTGLMLWSLFAAPEASPRVRRAMNVMGAVASFVGFYSYSIYLWHIPLREWIAYPLGDALGLSRDSYGSLAIYLSIAIGLGVVMAKLIEIPVLRWRDRMYPRKAERSAVQQLAVGAI